MTPITHRAAGRLLAAAAMLGPLPALAEYGLNLPRGVTPISNEVYDLHMLILWVCVAIGVLVFGAMFWSMLYHRKSRGAVAAQFHESTTIEIIWTIIPFLILIGMAIPATRTLIAMEDTSDADVSIKVTGYQWKWGYDYLEDEVSFLSTLSTPKEQIFNQQDKGEGYLLEVDNHMVVPVGKKVRLLLTAADVIHAWWVPELGIKKDAIPGFVNEMWFRADEPGIYRGQCAELCGKDHGFMPIVVEAVSEQEYAEWVAGQKGAMASAAADDQREFTMDELMARGEQVYAKHCVACHQPNGQGVPPTFPAIAGSPIATGDRTAHIDIVVNGSRKNPAMSAFGNQLGDADIAAVITYQRNAFGNDTGDVVQPSEIKAMRSLASAAE